MTVNQELLLDTKHVQEQCSEITLHMFGPPRDVEKTTLQQPQKRLALCLDATLGIKAHRWGPSKDTLGTPMPEREGRGWHTTRSTVRQTCTIKRQTPLSLTTYMVAEPCSVQSAQAGSSSEHNVDELDKNLTDSLWTVTCSRDKETRQAGGQNSRARS